MRNILFLTAIIGLGLELGSIVHVNATLTTGCHNLADVISNTVNLDPTQYDGVWFEQVRTRNSPFERRCFCSEANYTIAYDGSINVINTCRYGSSAAPISTANGKAIIPDQTHPGFLLVSFWIPFIKAPYAVVDTDYTDYAIVVSCPRFYGEGLVWILTREQQPSRKLIDGLKNKTADMGFSRANLIDTYQGTACNDSIHTIGDGDFEDYSDIIWNDYF